MVTLRRKSNQGRGYGWVPDLPDIRDKKYGKRLLQLFGATAPIPIQVDWRPNDTPIVDQGQLGSCTANALAGGLGFLEVKDGMPVAPFSRLFIYYNERAIEDSINADSGAMIRDGIKTLADQGACYETTWPYDISQFTVKPTNDAYTEGTKHEIIVYESLQSLDDMKDCLASGYPFVFGFTVYQSFESQAVASTGIVPMPSDNETALGGHAVMAVGYDDTKQWIIVRNSWGTGWGDKGYFYLPYDYISNPNLASDFWTIHKGLNMLQRPN